MKRIIHLVALAACILSMQRWAYSDTDMDVTAGERIYTQCTGCHAPAYHRTGPLHCGLLGRRAGSVAGFEFTPEMKDSGIIWTKETLNHFLMAPLEMIPGTSMGFAGITSFRDRMQLIAYLGTLTEDNPLCR